MKKTVSVLLFFLLSATNFPTTAENAQVLLQDAQKLITEGKHLEAAERLETILLQFPGTRQAKDAVFLITSCYVKLDQPDKAEETCLNALEKYQNDTAYATRVRNVLADFYISQKQYEKSIEQLQSILQIKPDYKTVLSLYEKIVSGYIALDQPDKAADTLQTLLEEYPGLVDEYSSDTSVLQYHRLRTQVDKDSFTAEIISRISSFYEKSNQPDLLNAAYDLLTRKFPESPYSIKGFRWLADNFAKNNKYAEAIPFYLKTIIGSTKPLYSFKTRLPENQIYLGAFNKERLTGSEIGKIVRDLYVFLEKDKKAGLTVSETEIANTQSSWEKAHEFVELNQFDKAIAICQEISQETQNPLSLLARYLISLCFYYQGNDRHAVAELTFFLEDKPLKGITSKDTLEEVFEKTLNIYTRTLAGYCYFNLGNYIKAEQFLKRVSEKSPIAAYKLAQAYEFQGKLKEARVIYRKLNTTENKELSDLSLFSLNRINSLEKSLISLSVSKAPEVLYIGEDRITKGNWRYNYGKELTILCGFNAPADWVEGSEQNKFKYDVYTGNPKDSAKTWLSKSFETAEYFLQYPGETEKRRPCNWDDHGETYSLGKGPDLFVSLSIPPGRHRLALYFLNDPNYYEPNRQYTVYIQDKNGVVLSATSVEDFYSGVYKRFLITGPIEITIRIFRNLSLNTLLSGVFIDSYKPDDFPAELWMDCENSQNIKNKIIGIYDKNKEIATKPDFSYADFENSQNLWHSLSETISDTYQREDVSWNKICTGFSLAHLFHQNWQYKERDDIVQKILKNWQEFPKTMVNKEEAINSQVILISQIYRTEWIKGNFKMEFTRHLADSITKFLTGGKVSYVSHKLIQTIPSGKSVSYQPWIHEFIIYEKLMESKLTDPFDMRKLGILYIDRGDPAKALPVFQQMVNATDDIRIKQDAYSRIMTVYARLSKEEEMKKALKELQTLDPFSSTSQEGEIELYQYLDEKGKQEESYKILKLFASKYPESEYLPFVKKQLQNIESK